MKEDVTEMMIVAFFLMFGAICILAFLIKTLPRI